MRFLSRMSRMSRVLSTIALLGISSLSAPLAGAQGTSGLNKINHIIVIMQENWSFDSLYGEFPGANGLANAGAATRQAGASGQPYTTLPQPLNPTLAPPGPDPRFPSNLPVQPFRIAQYAPAAQKIRDPVTRIYPQPPPP